MSVSVTVKRWSMSFRAERQRDEMMRPMHMFMQANARQRLKKTAAEWRVQAENSIPDVKSCLETVAQTGFPLKISPDQGTRVATFGLALIGHPEIFVAWSPGFEEQAAEILQDLVVTCLNGDGREKLQDGRQVLAARLGIGYMIKTAPDVSDSPLYAFLKQRSTAPTFAFELKFVMDARDDVDLPGFPTALSIWKKKRGVDKFTGLIKTPVPSPNWAKIGCEYGIAKLIDKNGPINGPCRMTTPEEAMRIFAKYDQ